MIWVDYVILGIITLSSIISISRGFVKEVLSLAAWAIATWVALTFSSDLSHQLNPYIETPSIRYFSGFLGLFLVTLVLAALINNLLSSLVEKTGLSGTDRMLGVIFGLARGVAIVTILIMLAAMTPMPQDPWWQQAQLISYFEPLVNWLSQLLPEEFSKQIQF